MGKVYLASDLLRDNQKVALKILSSDLQNDPLYLARFIREVELTQKVTHPNVVQTFETGKFNNAYYFSMEYVEGLTLSQILQGGSCSAEHCIEILSQLCKGLVAIHKIGIIHRDLKSTNVMINNQGQVKIADFGIARLDVSNLTVTDELLGSATHMAPEIWKQSEITKASDLYSLGVILYELLTAELPFQAETTYTLMWKHLKEQPKSPLKIKPDIPEWLANLCLSLLSKEKSCRPESALEILEILAQKRANSGSNEPCTQVPEKTVLTIDSKKNKTTAPKNVFRPIDDIWSIGSMPKQAVPKPLLSPSARQSEPQGFIKADANMEANASESQTLHTWNLLKKNLPGTILLSVLIPSILLMASHYLLPLLTVQLFGASLGGLVLLDSSEVAIVSAVLLIPFLFISSLLHGSGPGFLLFSKLCFIVLSVFFLIFAVNLLRASQGNPEIQIKEIIPTSIADLSEILRFRSGIEAPESLLDENSAYNDNIKVKEQFAFSFLEKLLPLAYISLILFLASALLYHIHIDGFYFVKPYYLLVPISINLLGRLIINAFEYHQVFFKIETRTLSLPIDSSFAISATLVWGSMFVCAIATLATKTRLCRQNPIPAKSNFAKRLT